MKQTERLTEAVKQYKAGKEDAFNTIYEESYKYLHTCVMHIVKNEDASQDMLQNTYLEVIKNIKDLNDPKNFLSWASVIANRKCFAEIKKDKEVLLRDSENESDTSFFENIPEDEALIPENIFDDRAKIEIIRGIIDELSDVQRACVIGFYYNDMKQEEIASELGIPVNTVKSHLNRAKSKIKDSVSDTERKQGIKLLAMAPFMLLFFNEEANACELTGASEAVLSAAKTGAAQATKAGMMGKAAAGAGVGKSLSLGKIVALFAGGVAIAGSLVFGIVKLNEVRQKDTQAIGTTVSESASDETASSEITEINEETTEASVSTEISAEVTEKTVSRPSWDFASKEEEIREACLNCYSMGGECWGGDYTLFDFDGSWVLRVRLYEDVFVNHYACIFSEDWESFDVMFIGEDYYYYRVAFLPEKNQIYSYIEREGWNVDISVIGVNEGKFSTDLTVRVGFFAGEEQGFVEIGTPLDWAVTYCGDRYENTGNGFETLSLATEGRWIDNGDWYPTINSEDSLFVKYNDYEGGCEDSLEKAFDSMLK